MRGGFCEGKNIPCNFYEILIRTGKMIATHKMEHFVQIEDFPLPYDNTQWLKIFKSIYYVFFLNKLYPNKKKIHLIIK